MAALNKLFAVALKWLLMLASFTIFHVNEAIFCGSLNPGPIITITQTWHPGQTVTDAKPRLDELLLVLPMCGQPQIYWILNPASQIWRSNNGPFSQNYPADGLEYLYLVGSLRNDKHGFCCHWNDLLTPLNFRRIIIIKLYISRFASGMLKARSKFYMYDAQEM